MFRRIVVTLAACLLSVGGSLWAAPPSVAVRDILVDCYEEETYFSVEISLSGIDAPAVASQATEVVPERVTITMVSDSGTYDALTRTITWGPFSTNLSRTVSYHCTAYESAVSPLEFTGTGSYLPIGASKVTRTTGGDTSVAICATPTPSPTPSPEPTATPTPVASAGVRSFSVGCFTEANFSVSIAFPSTVFVGNLYVTEYLPADWVVSRISDDGVYSSKDHQIEWGPFTSAKFDRQLDYDIEYNGLLRPSGAIFDGIVFDDMLPPHSAPIGGDTSVLRCIPTATPTETPTPTPSPTPSPTPTAVWGERAFGGSCHTADSLKVMITGTDPGVGVSIYLTEVLPVGWTASDISDDGTYLAKFRTINWGPFTNATWGKGVSYSAQRSESVAGDTAEWSGSVLAQRMGFPDAEAMIGGIQSLDPCADTPTPTATPMPTETPTPSPTPDYPGGNAAGDFNGDDCTNLNDFLFLLDNWQVDVGGEIMGLDEFLNLLDYWQMGPGC